MAGVGDKELIARGPWSAGIDNLNAETDLTRSDDGKQIVAFREGVNVDIDRKGTPSRRPGYTKIINGLSVHSLWHQGSFPLALFADGALQFAFRPGQTPFEVRDGLANRTISYALAGDRAFCTNPVQNWCVTPSGDTVPWGVETPAGQPNLTPSPDGGLDAGEYQVAITFIDLLGEESGTVLAATCTVAKGGGIELNQIPQPTSDRVRYVRAYRSAANGGNQADPNAPVLFMARDIPVGITSALLGVATLKRPLATQFLIPMPPGQIVRHLAGRLHVAAGNVIRSSEPLRYGLCHKDKGRNVGDKIVLMEPVGDGGDSPGFFVADSKRTYWIGGANPEDTSIRIVYPYSAVPGTGTVVPASMFSLDTTLPVAYWIAANGVACLGLPGGTVVPLREKQAVAPPAESGASLFRERNGIRQIISALAGATRTTKQGVAIGDSAAARVYRNGIEI